MRYYEIYPGGERAGEIVIETTIEPDADGLVVMTEDQYNQSFSRRGRECRTWDNYTEDYDVTAIGERVVLHPRSIPFDDPRVAKALAD